MLEEYLMNNVIRGIYLLWSIFRKTSSNGSCLMLLVQCGLMRLVSPSIEQANSKLLSRQILLTMKNICADRDRFTIESEPRIVQSLLKLIEISPPDNLVIIIDILGSLKIENAEGFNYEHSIEMINKVLVTGHDSPNHIKFTIIKVINQLFSEDSKGIATEENTDKIMGLIFASLKIGTNDIKVTACELMLKMIKTQIIELIKEPDIIYQILQNCMSDDPEQEALRAISIEIIYQMTVSVKYLCLIVLLSHQILDTVRQSLSKLHPELMKAINVPQKKQIKPEDIQNIEITDFISVREEDLISTNAKSQIEDINKSLNQSITSKNSQKVMEILQKKKKQLRKKSLHSVDTDKFFQDRSDVFSDFSDQLEDDFPDHLIDMPETVNPPNFIRPQEKDNLRTNRATQRLVRIVSILLSCDIAYAKIFAYNFHGLFGILLGKMVAERVACPQVSSWTSSTVCCPSTARSSTSSTSETQARSPNRSCRSSTSSRRRFCWRCCASSRKSSTPSSAIGPCSVRRSTSSSDC